MRSGGLRGSHRVELRRQNESSVYGAAAFEQFAALLLPIAVANVHILRPTSLSC